jgi:hypothetical protein
MSYFFFSGSRGLPAGVSLTVAALAIQVSPVEPLLLIGTVLTLPVLDVGVTLVMPEVAGGIEVELFSVVLAVELNMPAVTIGVGPLWYYDMIREGE